MDTFQSPTYICKTVLLKFFLSRYLIVAITAGGKHWSSALLEECIGTLQYISLISIYLWIQPPLYILYHLNSTLCMKCIVEVEFRKLSKFGWIPQSWYSLSISTEFTNNISPELLITMSTQIICIIIRTSSWRYNVKELRSLATGLSAADTLGYMLKLKNLYLLPFT